MSTLKEQRDNAVLARNNSAMLVRQSSSKAASLAMQLKEAKEKKDTVRYFATCDSLGNIVIVQEGQINEMLEQLAQTDSLMLYEVSIRDEVIELLQGKFVTCDSNLIAERGRFNKLYTTLRPRGQVWAGAEISGSAITPFNQAGVVLSYVPKSGSKMFSVGGGLQVQGGYYVKIGAQFKLSLRKK